MSLELVTHADPLAAVRGVLDGADEALLAVASYSNEGSTFSSAS